ncbi:MAG TPA: rhomboid family intramembrane serine protease [Phycisphaerales bacterium]|nr:rhomboid family intramembrane serine protease [Phycisphaerales bacterium]
MLIPLGTDRYKARPTLVTYLLIGANLVAFGAAQLLPGDGRGDPPWAAWMVLAPGNSPWWTYLSYAFVHADVAHLLFNMLALWVFGPDVEDRLGKIGFTALYVCGAVGAGVGHALLERDPVVGASGAIATVTGAFLVFFPYVHVRTLVFFIIVGLYHITAWWYIAFMMAADLFGLAWRDSNVAYGAHLGGYAMGIVVSLGLLALRVVPREPYDLFTIGRQAARRRAFRAAHAGSRRPAPVHRKAREPQHKTPDGPAATARLQVQERLATGDTGGAADAYLRMRGEPGAGELPPLGRRQLYEVANHLFQRGDYSNAVDAYRELLAAYGNDPEAPRVLLMLGLINARYLNDPTEAKRLLKGAAERLGSEEDVQLARELLEEIG